MNTITSVGTSGRRFLAVFLSLCLLLPGAALADGKNGNGKKNFKEGVKYEQQQQWDMAAQYFAMALSAEPNNPEYKIHYLQALQRASIMYVGRGDALAEQNDYPSAYTAYRQAYQLDPGNEIAKFKLERMLELQKAQAGGGNEPVNYNSRTGNIRQTTNEIQTAPRPRAKGETARVQFKDSPFKAAVSSLGRQLGLNVVFDDSVKDDKVTVDMDDVTPARALDIILLQKKHAFEQVDRRTIFVYPDNGTNRPRFEKFLIKTFYLGNISAQTAKTVLSQMLPPGRQVASVDSVGGSGGASSSNILIVKATPAELQLVQDLLSNIDKNKNEVVLDIEIYEVSKDSLLQIGNQIATSPFETRSAQPLFVNKDTNEPIYDKIKTPSLTNIGGFGNPSLLPGAFGNVGLLSAFGASGAGFLLGLPPTSLSLLQSQGSSKLLHKTQIHVLDGGQNQTKVGRSVPVRLGTQFGYGGGGLNVLNTGGATTGNNGIAQTIGNALAGGLGGGFGGFNSGFDSIQYRDVGLVIDAQPVITNEGYVEIKMKFETSDVVASGSDAQNLTPIFTQRSLNTVARIQDGVTSVVAGVNQESKGDSRAGIPVLGMVPFLGRLFTTPRQDARQSDVIITVTPHIVRSAGITQKDYYALVGPPTQGGLNQSIEDVVNRAQIEEDQERRIIAKEQSPGVPLDTPVAAPGAQPAGFNNPQRPAVTQPAGFNPPPRPAASSQSVIQPVKNSNVIDNKTIGAPPKGYSNTSANVPEVPETPQPETPVNPGDAGSDNPQPGQAGQDGATPDLSALVTPPAPARQVSPATVIPAQRPERVDRAIANLLAEQRARQAAEANRPKQEEPQPEIPKDLLVAPKQKVTPATVKAVANRRENSAVNFSLSPQPIKEQVGKTFTVTVEVSGQEQMSGANIALKYDASKLQVKMVRDAGMFGPQPDFSYDMKQKGVLIVTVKQPQNAMTAASGRLITVEFSAIGEGQSEIAFNGNETSARIGSARIPAGGGATQVIIGRDSVASSNEK